FLHCADQRWHVVHVDAYAHQVYVPAHLASRQFFTLARERLHPGGVIACNVGALHADDAVLQAIAATMVEVFGHAHVLLVPRTRNALLVARRGSPPDASQLAAAATHALSARVGTADRAHWQGLVAAAARPGAWRHLRRGGLVLDDDRPVLDALLADSYIARDDATELVPCQGPVDAPGAEAAAYAAQLADDVPGVLDAVRSSRVATAYLREQAARMRWRMRSLSAAAAEYDAALALGPDADQRARIVADRAVLQTELDVRDRADAAARRNGWLQVLAIGLLPLAVLALRRVA
ncbi:MAG: fused MFS/spermidine synthase, partial [Planctomycetes bacterium]|nr:fused MFS/spermidine synthase [Planctomycetota bacterium]